MNSGYYYYETKKTDALNGDINAYSKINTITLKNFFLEGCRTGEDVFKNYDVILNRKGRSSLEVMAIYFKRDTFTNEIQVKYRNGMKEKIRIHELEFLREYIFFD